MDYLFASSIVGCELKLVTISYDVGCQWFKKFYSRMSEAFPLSWRINTRDVDIRFLVPKFHLPAHIEKCQQSFSFNYARFVGRTDGEAPERGWSDLNGLSYSTREMGPGARQDTIEDHLGDWNWKKIIAMGKPGRLFTNILTNVMDFSSRYKPSEEDKKSNSTIG